MNCKNRADIVGFTMFFNIFLFIDLITVGCADKGV